MKILHSADWHIGNLKGPEKNGKNLRFEDTLNCIKYLISKANEEKPDIVLLSGDIFHQAKVWADRGLFEVREAIKLIDELACVCDVMILRGTPNHDGEEQFNMLKTHFALRKDVKVFIEPELIKHETRSGKILQIVAIPGFNKGVERIKLNGEAGDEEAKIFSDNLNRQILELADSCEDGITKVLMTHYSVNTIKFAGSEDMMFANIEPVINKETLAKAKFDLVALGHIHTPQMVVDNVYYSGAINTITFNDEGEKRGFWIHELNKNEHNFIKTPFREMLSINLYGKDIETINLGNFDELFEKYDVENKIIRVRYSCSDEENNLFNKSLLEKRLYTKGAFYVHAITLDSEFDEINKENLYEESDPLTNLKTYLEQVNMYDEDIIETAKPVIVEAINESEVRYNSGVFEPVKIEVKNYRNYEEEVFDFSNVSFCVINGKNGSGKSSLFMDAIVECLFEDPRREDELTGWIRANAKSGSITFTFKIGEKLFKVTRTRMRSGKATLSLAEFVGDEWQNRSKEKFKDTESEIINVIGMDSLTFRSCALIMQDQYGLFLDSKMDDRMNTLINILGLGIYDSMENKVRNILTELNREFNNKSEEILEADNLIKDLNEVELKIEEYNNLIKDIKGKIEVSELKREKLNITLLTKENFLKDIEKLVENENNIIKKIAETEENLKLCEKIGVDNQKIVDTESQIVLGVKRYNQLVEEEKKMLINKSSYDNKLKICNERKEERNKSNLLCIKFENDYKKALEDFELLKAKTLKEEEFKKGYDEYSKKKLEYEKMNLKASTYVKLNEKLNGFKEEYSNVNKEYAENITKKKAELKNLLDKVEILKSSNCIDLANANCRFLSDAKKAKLDIEPLEKEIANLTKFYEDKLILIKDNGVKVKEEIAKLEYDGNMLNGLKDEVVRLEKIAKDYESLMLEKQRLQFVQEAINQKKALLDNELINRKELDEKILLIEKELENFNEILREYEQLRKSMKENEQWLEKEKQLPIARERINNAKTRFDELSKQKNEYLEQQKENSNSISKLKKEVGDIELLRNELNQIVSELKQKNEIQNNYNSELGAYTQKKKELLIKKEKIEEIKKNLKELSKKINIYEILKNAFSQDGIPHNIIRSVIPILTKTANNILGNMTSGKTQLEFRTQKVQKSNKKEIVTLDIFINEEGIGVLPYSSKSGGEKVKAALSSIIALAEIKASCAGVQLGMLFIDEPPFLDEEGVQAYCDALNTIGERYKNIKVMAITHDPTMKARFRESIEVVKTENGSKIVV